MSLSLSVIIPAYNEEVNVEKSIKMISRYLSSRKTIKEYELIIIDNKSLDGTWKKLLKMAKRQKSLVCLQTEEPRYLGSAIKMGILSAKYRYVYFTAVDHPYGFTDADQFLNIYSKYDLIFASRNNFCINWRINSTRKAFSLIYSGITRLLFGLQITDSQGTFLGRTSFLKSIIPVCNSKGPFFQTQVCLYSNKLGGNVCEVPVAKDSIQIIKRPSKFKPRDGFVILWELFKERYFFRSKIKTFGWS